jgi:hypothetical protein
MIEDGRGLIVHCEGVRVDLESAAAAAELVAAVEGLGGRASQDDRAADLSHPSGHAGDHEQVELTFFVRAWDLSRARAGRRSGSRRGSA